MFTINIDGTGKAQIREGLISHPGWARDGALIAYVLRFQNRSDIHVTDPAGTSNLPALTQTTSANEIDLIWSNNGSMIAFVQEQEGRRDVWTMKADGTSPISLTFDAALNENPRWSPDDRFLTFESNRDGQWEVYRIASDGSGLTNVSRSPADDRNGDWLPCPP